MSDASVVVHATKELVAAATAARLIVRLSDAQTARGEASFVATGGGLGIAVLAAVAGSPARDAVDWSRVDVWWGDERFLPEGDPERNYVQAKGALLDKLPLDPARVHVMAPSDGPRGNDPDAAAADYAAELAGAAPPDVALYGVGPDGHVASLFPGHPGTHERELAVIGVRGSPKPPPVRISLTFGEINRAREIWLVAAGAEKAAAIAMALAPTPEDQLPAAGLHGTERTVWLLDRAAASTLPRELSHPPAP